MPAAISSAAGPVLWGPAKPLPAAASLGSYSHSTLLAVFPLDMPPEAGGGPVLNPGQARPIYK